MTIIVFVFLAIYVLLGILSFLLKASCKIFKLLFKIGIYLVCPALVIFLLVIGLLGAYWEYVGIIAIICLILLLAGGK